MAAFGQLLGRESVGETTSKANCRGSGQRSGAENVGDRTSARLPRANCRGGGSSGASLSGGSRDGIDAQLAATGSPDIKLKTARAVASLPTAAAPVVASKEKPASPRRHPRRLSRANSLGSQNSLVAIDEENALTEAAVAKALQDQQAQAAGPYYKRRCWALVCVAVWTYAIVYFAALYSYRLEALRLRRVIRGA